MKKKVFVSGCYDMLHSGHVAFFKEAAEYGDLYVGIGSDKTIFELKGRKTIQSDKERLYMVGALKSVKKAFINKGGGILDFKEDILELKPDILFVNEDGHTIEKEKLCKELGIQYIISKRLPSEGLPKRSTTALRKECRIPYRIDLAGGWLDQPFVSKFYPGSVITISIEPDYEFNDRSGMSTSTRKKAIELWQTDVPEGNLEKIAKILFCYENAPGSEYISGSQDSIGIVYPGLNNLCYRKGQYWPSKIEHIEDLETLEWLEKRIYLLSLSPRGNTLNVTENNHITIEKAKALATAADLLWNGVMHKNTKEFAKGLTDSYHAQIAMFPNMVTEEVEYAIQNLPDSVLGYKLCGAGGGGYLFLFSEEDQPNTLRIRIRR